MNNTHPHPPGIYDPTDPRQPVLLKEGRLYCLKQKILFFDPSGKNQIVPRDTILIYLGWSYHPQLLEKRHVFMLPSGKNVNLSMSSDATRARDFITNYFSEIDPSASTEEED